jgi:hypothetical protein
VPTRTYILNKKCGLNSWEEEKAVVVVVEDKEEMEISWNNYRSPGTNFQSPENTGQENQ